MTGLTSEWIIFLKGKLLPIDNCLPLVLSAKKFHPHLCVTLITSARGYSELISNEPFLKEMLLEHDIKLIAPEADEKKFKKIIRRLNLLLILTLKSFSRRIVFFDSHHIGKVGLAFAKVNRILFGGKKILLLLSNIEKQADHFHEAIGIEEFKRKKRVFEHHNCDGIITSFDPDQFANGNDLKNYRLIKSGYIRGLPYWIKRNQECTLAETEIAKFPNGYLFWPLSVLNRVEKGNEIFDLEFSILKSLEVFKTIRPELGVIFRHHPTTDKVRFQEILALANFENYLISKNHPIQLMMNSDFVFSNVGSTIFCDAWFHGIPTVQFSPDHKIFGKHNEQEELIAPSYEPVIDYFFTDENKFRETLLSTKYSGLSTIHSKQEKQKRMPVSSIETIIYEIEKL